MDTRVYKQVTALERKRRATDAFIIPYSNRDVVGVPLSDVVGMLLCLADKLMVWCDHSETTIFSWSNIEIEHRCQKLEHS